MAGSFLFVTANSSTGKAGGQDRALIRRHCMQGKNQKPNSRRSLQAARAANLGPWRRPQSRSRSVRTAALSPPEALDGKVLTNPDEVIKRDRQHSLDLLQQGHGPRLESVLQFFHQDSVVYPREFMFNLSAFKQVKSLTSPLTTVLHFDGMDSEAELRLAQDNPFRQATVLFVSAYREYTQQRKLSHNSYEHHRATLALLISRLSNVPGHYLVDTTIYIINVLAAIALWLARHDEVVTHVLALKQIVDLRGGWASLRGEPFLMYHLQCLDLASSMASGDNLAFHDDVDTKSVHTQEPDEQLAQTIHKNGGLLDSRVTSIYGDLQSLLTQMNVCWTRKETLDYSVFQSIYDINLRRLVALQDSLADTASECFRLGLLAFLTTLMFRVPNTTSKRAGEAVQFAYLTSSYRRACRTGASMLPRSNVLAFWVLFIGAMTVFTDEDQEWLVDKIATVTRTLSSTPMIWEDARAHLEGVLWIRGIHDEMGQKIHAKLVERPLV